MSLPDDVEEAMADIAVVFHWAPSELDRMAPEELARWWGHARRRAPQED